VTRPTLSEVIEGRLISDASEIVATLDEPVRAIDLLGRFAAVYRFSADDDGAWFEECVLAVKTGDGQWVPSGAGGSHGEGWELPWRPSSLTLDGRTVWVFGSAGGDLIDDDDRPVFVRGIYGFVEPQVRAIRVSSEDGERTVAVTSPVGAFVVLVRGEGAVELQGLDEAGANLGQPVTKEPIEKGRWSGSRRRSVHHRRVRGLTWRWTRP